MGGWGGCEKTWVGGWVGGWDLLENGGFEASFFGHVSQEGAVGHGAEDWEGWVGGWVEEKKGF